MAELPANVSKRSNGEAETLGALVPADQAEYLNEGLPWPLFEAFSALLGIEPFELFQRIGVPERTAYRRLGERLSRVETERVLRLARWHHRAAIDLKGADQATKWITETGRIESASLGIDVEGVLQELQTRAIGLPESVDGFVARIPFPPLPSGFSATHWKRDEGATLPNTVAISCTLTAELNGRIAKTVITVTPSVGDDEPTLERLVYDRVTAGIARLRLETFCPA